MQTLSQLLRLALARFLLLPSSAGEGTWAGGGPSPPPAGLAPAQRRSRPGALGRGEGRGERGGGHPSAWWGRFCTPPGSERMGREPGKDPGVLLLVAVGRTPASPPRGSSERERRFRGHAAPGEPPRLASPRGCRLPRVAEPPPALTHTHTQGPRCKAADAALSAAFDFP